MKRKESLFEQKLIENGWKLHSKRYCGKHSEKVFSYVYFKEFESLGNKTYGYVNIRKRDLKVVDIMFDNVFCEINFLTKDAICTLFEKIKNEITQIRDYATYNGEK